MHLSSYFRHQFRACRTQNLGAGLLLAEILLAQGHAQGLSTVECLGCVSLAVKEQRIFTAVFLCPLLAYL